MIRTILLVIGISLLIGLGAGYYRAETKYFFMLPQQPKREITYANYLEFQKKTRDEDSGIITDRSIYTTQEKIYNQEFAVIAGLGALGSLLIVSYFFNLLLKRRSSSSLNHNI